MPLDDEDVRRFHAEWLKADLDGEVRDLAFYLRRGREGDKDAATRAFQLCAASFTPEALAQNGWLITPVLAEAAREAFLFAMKQPVSKLFDLRHRPKDHNRANIRWDLALEVYRLLQQSPERDLLEVCEEVVGELDQDEAKRDSDTSARTLMDAYPSLLPTIEKYFAEGS